MNLIEPGMTMWAHLEDMHQTFLGEGEAIELPQGFYSGKAFPFYGFVQLRVHLLLPSGRYSTEVYQVATAKVFPSKEEAMKARRDVLENIARTAKLEQRELEEQIAAEAGKVETLSSFADDSEDDEGMTIRELLLQLHAKLSPRGRPPCRWCVYYSRKAGSMSGSCRSWRHCGCLRSVTYYGFFPRTEIVQMLEEGLVPQGFEAER
jgi:hypothetical protein